MELLVYSKVDVHVPETAIELPSKAINGPDCYLCHPLWVVVESSLVLHFVVLDKWIILIKWVLCEWVSFSVNRIAWNGRGVCGSSIPSNWFINVDEIAGEGICKC